MEGNEQRKKYGNNDNHGQDASKHVTRKIMCIFCCTGGSGVKDMLLVKMTT